MNPTGQAAFHRHRDQEQPVSSQPFSMSDHLHRLGDIVDANPLVSRLLAAGLGSRLTDVDAGHITAIVAAIEQVREQQGQQQAAAFVPADATDAQQAATSQVTA